MSRTRPWTSVSPSRAGVSRTSTAPGPKGSTTRPSAASSLGAGADPLGLGGVELDHLGQQQGLARDAAVGHLGLHPLIDQALVGGVLVDDDHAVAGLGDDVGLVHLGPRGAERIVDGIEHLPARRVARDVVGRRDLPARARPVPRRRQDRAATAAVLAASAEGPAARLPRREAGALGSAVRGAASPAGPEAAKRRAGDGGRGAVAGAGQGMAQARR